MPSTPVGRMSRAVDQIRALDGVDLAFSARLDRTRRTFSLDDLRGTRGPSLHGLVSPVGYGVGGKCLALRRPIAVVDYVLAPTITHQFDDAVSREGLRAVVAVPFRIDGEVRGVVYGASRHPNRLGDRFADVAESIVHSAERAPPPPDPVGAEGLGVGHNRPEMRELHAELRAIAAGVAEPAARDRILSLCHRLSGGVARAGHPATRLTPREVDVLAQIAVGCSNTEVAARLSLRVETVKSYLKTAMAKLDSRNRGEAVFAAQRAGLIP